MGDRVRDRRDGSSWVVGTAREKGMGHRSGPAHGRVCLSPRVPAEPPPDPGAGRGVGSVRHCVRGPELQGGPWKDLPTPWVSPHPREGTLCKK